MSITAEISSENLPGEPLVVPDNLLEGSFREELPSVSSFQHEMGAYYAVDGIHAVLKDLYVGQYPKKIKRMIRERLGLGDDEVVQLRDHKDLASECFVELVLRRLRPLLASLGEEGIRKLV